MRTQRDQGEGCWARRSMAHAVALVVLAGFMTTCVAGSAAAAPPRTAVSVSGSRPHSLGICGQRRPVAVRFAGRQPTIRVLHPRAGDVVAVDRCEAGRWQRKTRRRTSGVLVTLPATEPGDYRIRVRSHRHVHAVALAFVRLVPRPTAQTDPGHVPQPDSASTVDIPVTFHVKNQNRSHTACSSDNGAYDVKGHLVGPKSMFRAGARSAVTVYLHNIGWGAFYWHFQRVAGYDFVGELAREGHASVVYDMLDYGDSGRPAPNQTCYGSEADVASQIAGALRSGHYTLGDQAAAPKFGRVALASQSIAGQVSQPEAYSFNDIDALIVTGWADQGFSQRFQDVSRDVELGCAKGGDNGTGYFRGTEDEFRGLYFANADPQVVDAATVLRTPIPCGEPQSAFQTIGADIASDGQITAPVLLVYGRQDAAFNQPGAGQQQKSLYSGSHDVTLAFIDGAGQALALERTAPAFRRLISDWLSAHGF